MFTKNETRLNPMTKTLIPTENITTINIKTQITQRLQIDLGRSVRVKTATQLGYS